MNIAKIPVECIALHDIEGNIRPHKIRYEDVNGEIRVVEVSKLIYKDIKKLPGESKCNLFECRAINSGVSTEFKLLYNVDKCKWYLL